MGGLNQDVYYIYVHKCVHTYINIHTCPELLCVYRQANCMYTSIHTCTHTHIHTYALHTYIHTYVHVFTYLHTHIHIHTYAPTFGLFELPLALRHQENIVWLFAEHHNRQRHHPMRHLSLSHEGDGGGGGNIL
jgi:hypothetical protein